MTKRNEQKRAWKKANCKDITGLRPRCAFLALEANWGLTTYAVTPNDFLIKGKTQELPCSLYGTNVLLHVPRSLCHRARITIKLSDGSIVATSKMNYANL
jgi:hypothetical protein